MRKQLAYLLFSLLPTLTLAQNPTSPEEQYKLGKDYYEQQNYSQAINWFTKAAEQNHSKAEFYLGICYENGKEVKQDYQQAILWFQKAAEHGLDEAQCRLGSNYFNGIGVKQNYQQAAFWYRKAAEQDFSSAQCTLGYYYENGYGVEKDQKQAIVWYRKAASQGHRMAANNLKRLGITDFTVDRNNPTTPEEQYELGMKFYNTKDYEQAVYWLRLSAERGYAEAQTELGGCYHAALGVQKDDEQAIIWFKKAAEQDNANGELELGVMYYYGWGVEKNYEQAVYWYKKAAEQGNTNAMNNLGICYGKGHGVTKDREQAIYWYRKAAEQKNAYGQYNLGYYCYHHPESEQGYYWYKRAARQKLPNAFRWTNLYKKDIITTTFETERTDSMYERADKYFYEKNYEQAVLWYQKAAEENHPVAQYCLGLCYENGYGVTQDHVKAVSWFQKAAEQGIATAQGLLGKYYLEVKDYSKAFSWSNKSVEAGARSGCYTLGICYYYGYGVERDYKKAEDYFKRVQDNTPEYADALYYIGDINRYRRGKKGDARFDSSFDGEAIQNWFLAARNGHQKSIDELRIMGYVISSGNVVDENNNPVTKAFVNDIEDINTAASVKNNGHFITTVAYSDKMKLYIWYYDSKSKKRKNVKVKIKPGDNGAIVLKGAFLE